MDTKKSDVSPYFVVRQTEQFVQALKEELVKCALLEIHNQCIANANSSHVHSNGLLCENYPADQEQDGGRHDTEYDEEEWASWSVCDVCVFPTALYDSSFYMCLFLCRTGCG